MVKAGGEHGGRGVGDGWGGKLGMDGKRCWGWMGRDVGDGGRGLGIDGSGVGGGKKGGGAWRGELLGVGGDLIEEEDEAEN